MMSSLLDRDTLKKQFLGASPFPFIKIDRFLEPTFAEEVAACFPSFQAACSQGTTFNAVNERKKIQITDSRLFPKAIAKLNTLLASPSFLADLSYITGIPNLLADDELVGGGMHITGPGGRLDVHVDFNYLGTRKIFRRLNLLVYLNPVWESDWGGDIQLWDKDVKTCRAAFSPVFNRCIVFETSGTSYHGVTPVTITSPVPRISFAAYYYTREAPCGWDGIYHSTIFKARPEERLRGYILMPAEIVKWKFASGIRYVKREIKKIVSKVC